MRVSIQRIALRDILPNRYRHIDRYRISASKIDALLQSYENSGFWDGSIQARPHPTREGKVEIAFGHHRIEAAKRARLSEVGLVVAKRSDADMLRMMADENREEFKGDHLVAIETVAATIEAFGRAEIELPPVDPVHGRKEVYDLPGGKSYSLATVARFLGWIRPSNGQATDACRLAYEAYHEQANIVPALAELPEDDRTRQATGAVLTAARSARKIAKKAGKSKSEQEAAARRAAKDTVSRIKKGDIASKVRDEAVRIGRESAGVERTPIEISQFVHQRADGLKTRAINLEQEVDALLNEILPYRRQIDEPAERYLLKVLGEADERLQALFEKWLERFSRLTTINVTPQRKRLGA